MAEHSIGFLGVGTLAKAMILGLRKRWPELEIQLSPRSEKLSSELAAADPKIHRHGSNAAVVAASDVIFLTVRPPQFEEAVRDLRFRPDQLVLSCLAGMSIAEVRERCAPAEVARVLPIPAIERSEGPIVLCPSVARARALFDGLGDIVDLADEASLAAIWPCSAFMSPYFALQSALIDWAVERGVDRTAAVTYVRSLLRALATTSALTDLERLDQLIQEHETPGGLNYRVRLQLESAGWFAAVGDALDMTSRLRGAQLTNSTTS